MSAIAAAVLWQVGTIGDFNFDQKSDIVWREAGGTVAMWEMAASCCARYAIVEY